MRWWCAAMVVAACHSDPDRRTSCAAVADHVYALLADKDDHAHRIHDAFAHHCIDDRWSRTAIRCFLEEQHLRAGKHCRQERLTGEQRTRLDTELAAIDDARVPQPCVLFRSAVDTLAKCENASQVIETQKHAYAQVKPKIDSVTRATFKDLAELCDEKLAQVEQLSAAVGCDP